MPLSRLEFRCIHRHNGLPDALGGHQNCYKKYLEGDNTVSLARHERKANVLIADVETIPGEAFFFTPKTEYISPDKVIKNTAISSIAWTWLGSGEVFGETVTPEEAYNRDDKRITKIAWDLFDKANVVVFHNGRGFDIKVITGKFIDHRLPAPSKYFDVDTLQVARQVTKWEYKSLNEIGKRFGIGEKTTMYFEDWRNCLTNDKNAKIALDKMLEYCKKDVAPLLEDVYLILLPHMKNHPNLGIFSDHVGDICPRCESSSLDWSVPYPTYQGVWRGFRCNRCGSVGRGLGKDKKLRGVNVR